MPLWGVSGRTEGKRAQTLPDRHDWRGRFLALVPALPDPAKRKQPSPGSRAARAGAHCARPPTHTHTLTRDGTALRFVPWEPRSSTQYSSTPYPHPSARPSSSSYFSSSSSPHWTIAVPTFGTPCLVSPSSHPSPILLISCPSLPSLSSPSDSPFHPPHHTITSSLAYFLPNTITHKYLLRPPSRPPSPFLSCLTTFSRLVVFNASPVISADTAVSLIAPRLSSTYLLVDSLVFCLIDHHLGYSTRPRPVHPPHRASTRRLGPIH